MLPRSFAHRLTAAFFASLLLAAAPSLAAQPVLSIPGVADVDQYDTIAELGSKGTFAGFAVSSSREGDDPVRLLIYLPPLVDDSLCVDVISHDAAYRGRFRFPAPRDTGWHFLDLPTREANELRRLGVARLAPLAHLAPRCSGDRGVAVPAGWGGRHPRLHLRVMVNPEPVERVFAAWRNDPREFPCRVIPYARRIAFGYVCELGPAPGAGRRELRIQQVNGRNQPLPAAYVPVWVPDAL